MSISSHLSSYQRYQNEYFYRQALAEQLAKEKVLETFPRIQNNQPQENKQTRQPQQAPSRQVKSKQSNMKTKNSNIPPPPPSANPSNKNNKKKQVQFDDMDEGDDFDTSNLSLHNQLYDNSNPKDNEYDDDIDLGEEDSYSEEDDENDYDDDMMSFIEHEDETKEQDSILNDLKNGFEPSYVEEGGNSKKRPRTVKKQKTASNTNITRK